MGDPMELECFKIHDTAPELVPGRPDRLWMDHFVARFPYRCLPLVMANTTGWEILCPDDFSITWSGGLAIGDVLIQSDSGADISHFAASHFTSGVVTFHTGYLFRTPPGWALWATGAPNHFKDGIAPLAGLVESDWLPFPFTMNWQMTRPGTIRFAKGEPFCFILPVENRRIDEFQPVIKRLDDDAELKAQYLAWSQSRGAFNRRINEGDAEAIKAGWQKHYFRGEMPGGAAEAPADHMNRRRLKAPVPKP